MAYTTAVPSCLYYKYPQWANHPLASSGVIRVNACVMAASSVSRVRAAVARKLALNFDQHSSMGERSGEYGGKYSSLAPTDSIAV